MGNKGQVDYAMANEVLNKTALHLAQGKKPASRWFPSIGGRGTAEWWASALKREFARRNVGLISPAKPAAKAWWPNSAGGHGHLPGGGFGPWIFQTRPSGRTGTRRDNDPGRKQPEEDLRLTFKRQITRKNLPVLLSHVLDGVPVMPFALMVEWLGMGALHGNPGLFLRGMEDFRLLNGIRLDTETREVRLMAGKAQKRGHDFLVNVEMRDGYHQGRVSGAFQGPGRAGPDPACSTAGGQGSWGSVTQKPFPLTIDEIYEKVLFHGEKMRGIRQVLGYSDKGMAAKVIPAPPPSDWMTQPLEKHLDRRSPDAGFGLSTGVGLVL